MARCGPPAIILLTGFAAVTFCGAEEAQLRVVQESQTTIHRRPPAGVFGLAVGEAGLKNGELDSIDGSWETWVAIASPAGTITIESGRAKLAENASFLVSLYQTFAIPEDTRSLSFEVYFDPGFDRSADFIPDAFEVQLLDQNMQSVVPTWDPLATSFFNAQEDLSFNLGPGVRMAELPAEALPAYRVTVDLSAVPAGTVVTLYNDLIGADSDTNSSVQVDNFILNTQPPIIDPGGPYETECDGEPTVLMLDASRSYDPDGLPLTYAWRTECSDAVIAEPDNPASLITLPPGTSDCDVTLTVSDGDFPAVSATTTVRVTDTTPPQLECPELVEVRASDVAGVPVGEVALTAMADDKCGDVKVTDDRPADRYPLGDTMVTFTATDEAGLTSACSTTVRVIGPLAVQCEPVVERGFCPDELDEDNGGISALDYGLPEPVVENAVGAVTVSNDAPTILPVGFTMVIFTVRDEAGQESSCMSELVLSVLDPGSAPCQDVPGGRFQERLTTTTTEIGFLGCGLCGPVGVVQSLLMLLGLTSWKRRIAGSNKRTNRL